MGHYKKTVSNIRAGHGAKLFLFFKTIGFQKIKIYIAQYVSGTKIQNLKIKKIRFFY